MSLFKELYPVKMYALFIGASILLAIGVFMTFQKSVTQPDMFDTVWALGDPVAIEHGFNNLLNQKEIMQDMSMYLQIQSQKALAQALQKKFDDAHETLDKAEQLLTGDYKVAHVRILLERGRVFHQSGDIAQARNFFEQAYALSFENAFDYHTINAAHMIAIIATPIDEKIRWNQQAIALAEQSNDKRAQEWLGSLYNNIGQNYLKDRQFEKALSSFKTAVEYRKKEGYAPNIRFANWAVARALRSLNRVDEALLMQSGLLEEYDRLATSGTLDMPLEMFSLMRGWIYEELAELHAIKMKTYAKFAYDELSKNTMFQEVEPQRLRRLEELQNRY